MNVHHLTPDPACRLHFPHRPLSQLDTWRWTSGGRVLYDGTVCPNCGGLQVEFGPDTILQYGVALPNPYFVVCPQCESPADVATRLDWRNDVGGAGSERSDDA